MSAATLLVASAPGGALRQQAELLCHSAITFFRVTAFMCQDNVDPCMCTAPGKRDDVINGGFGFSALCVAKLADARVSSIDLSRVYRIHGQALHSKPSSGFMSSICHAVLFGVLQPIKAVLLSNMLPLLFIACRIIGAAISRMGGLPLDILLAHFLRVSLAPTLSGFASPLPLFLSQDIRFARI